MATPDFFSENYNVNNNKRHQPSLSSPNTYGANNKDTKSTAATTNGNGSSNHNHHHHPVVHQGRDLEPRELNVNFVSSPGAILSPHRHNNQQQHNTNSRSRNHNNHHQQQQQQHHSVSPIPAAARHNFLSHLRTNTEPPTPVEDIEKYNNNNDDDDELLVEGITQEDVVGNDYENDEFVDDDEDGELQNFSTQHQVRSPSNGAQQQQQQQNQQHRRAVSNATPSQTQQQQQSKSTNRNRSNPSKSTTSTRTISTNNNNKQQALRRISPSTNNNNNNNENHNNNQHQYAKSAINIPSLNTPSAAHSKNVTPVGDDYSGGAAGVSTTNNPTPVPKSRNKNRGRIFVAVRKRPNDGDAEDCVEIESPQVMVSATKLRVDLSEYTEQHNYEFDHAFDEKTTNVQVYQAVAKPLLDIVFKGGSASCFAYGQTGSGKTYTQIGSQQDPGLYVLAARDIFQRITNTQRVYVSLYEIYCNSLFDLLNSRQVVIAREDGNKRVNVCGLTWHEVSSVKELIEAIDRGTDQRRTGSTSANEFSSRSHAIMSLTVRDDQNPKYVGILNVVDLAGSERAADTSSNDRQTRLEGAEINKSLLALKECIRGLDEKKKHIPFRGSKLTEVLRDSFVGSSRTVMIATISPNPINSEHTLNTLRYAFRVKGLTVEAMAPSKDRKMEKLFAPVGLPPAKSMMIVGGGNNNNNNNNNNPGEQSTTSNIGGGDSGNNENMMIDNETQFSNNNLIGQDGYIRQGNMKRRPHRNDVKRTNSQHHPTTNNDALPKATGKTESPTTSMTAMPPPSSLNNNNQQQQQQQHQQQQQQHAPLDLRVGPIGGAGAASLANLESRMNLQIRELREELKGLRDVKAKDDVKIAELSSMNKELLTRMDELCKLASNNIHQQQQQQQGGGNGKGAPVQLPPM